MAAQDNLLVTARDAYRRRDWRASYDQFAQARAVAPLSTDDLAALGMVSWRLGRSKESIQLSELVHTQLIDAGDDLAAAMKAAELGLLWMMCGDLTTSGAWANRTRRLLRDAPEAPAHGYLLFLDAFAAIFGGDCDTAAELADALQEMGRRQKSPALTSLGQVARAGAARRGDAPGARRPGAAGVGRHHLCSVIHYCHCHCLADRSRTRAWISAMERWCEWPAAAAAYGGVCDIHKLQLLSATKNYVEIAQALMTASSALEDVNGWAADEGYYELGEARRRTGDTGGAMASFAKARELGYEPQPGEALLRCGLGDHQEAWTDLRIALEGADDLLRIPLLRCAVDIALGRDDVACADEYCGQLESSAERFATPGFEAWALHARGAVLVKQNRPDEALAALRRALRFYRSQKCRYETAQCYEWISLAHSLTGDHAAAEADAATAASIYRQLGVVTGGGCGTPDAPGGLTRRELEVMAGIAAGASNRQLAQDLFISEKTVGRHLANIYTKLGVSSRTAAAWAHENHVTGATST